MAGSRPKRSRTLSDGQFSAIARALSDPRRFAILRQIAGAPPCMPCSALQEHDVISAPTISHHLKELAEAGLIDIERAGRTASISFCRPTWQAYLDRLGSL